MAITYVSNPLITQGNYPLDARTVTTFDQMPNIKYPFIGMQVYVTEEEATYLINQDCLVSDGDGGFDMNPDVNELKKHCVKIATSDNIIGLLDGITVVGPSGPGIEKRYCLGTENDPKYELTDKTVREPYGWDTTRPTPTELLPFVWSIEAQIIWNSDEQAYTALGPDGWSSPMKENGEPGTSGKDGETTLLAILDNPMDTVLLDANGNVSTGLPISTNFHVYEGTEELVVENLTYSVPDDADINSDYITVTVGTSSNPSATFTMKEGSIRNTISTKIPITLQGTVNVKGKDVVYHTTFLINKISAAAPNIIIDFANDNINIAADEAGVATTLTANNYINAFKGLDDLTIESVSCDDLNVTCDYLGNNEVKVTLAKFDTDTYNVLLNVNAKDDEDNVYTRSASFRLIKVKAGMPGEPAIFFEIKPNLSVIKTNSSGNIADSSKTLTATIIKHTGASIEEFELSNKPDNIIVYYDVDGDSLDTIIPDTGLNISNAITGDLDLDRYICLSLYDSNSASVIDKERIYMVHDGTPGENGVGYKLVASSVVIAKEYNGTVKNTEDTKVSLVKIEGEELINVTSIPEAYELRKSVDGVEEIINSLPDTISTTAMASIEDNVRYELWYVQTGASSEFIADSVTISVIKDAQPGVDGRMMYFAGEFNINESGESETITYTVDDTTVPYVYDDSGKEAGDEDAPIYFYLVTNSYSSTITPYNDYKAGNDNWRPITSMDVLYSKIGLFDTAKVGPAVFYKDWVFSQNDTNGKPNYKNFTFDKTTGEPTGALKPAVWFNFVTGQGSLANGNISWDKNGDVEFGPDVKLSWSSIKDAPSIDGGLSESEIEGIITRTEISGDQITTGIISADRIDVDNIEVKRLNTTPELSTSAGRILIADNEIVAYDSKKEGVKVLTITGDSFVDLSSVPEIKTTSIDVASTGSKTDNILFTESYHNYKLGTITIPSTGYNYNVSTTTTPAKLYVTASTSNTQNISTVYQVYSDIYFSTSDTCPNYEGDAVPINPFTPLEITAGQASERTKDLSVSLSGSNLSAGTYNIWYRVRFPALDGLNGGDTTILAGIVFTGGSVTATLTPVVDSVEAQSLTCIASNGFRFFKGLDQYFELDNNGYFKYLCGQGGFGCDAGGFWLRDKSTDYDISIDSEGNLKATAR